MDIKNNARLAWSVAAVLAVILIVVLFANAGGPVSWNDIGDRIREECSDLSEAGRDNCARSLGQLEEILEEIDQNASESETPTEAPAQQ